MQAIKAFSILTATGGLTYAITQTRDAMAKQAAELIGRKHKYQSQSGRWYVALDSIRTTNPIDGLLPLVWPWKPDDQEAEKANAADELFKSWYVPVKAKEEAPT